MAIGLVLLAAIVALPVALGAWAFGYVTPVGAILMYFGAGWAVILSGILSGALAQALARLRPETPARPPVRVEVRVVPRN